MRVEEASARDERQRDRGRGLGDEPHGAVRDGVLLKAFARQRRVVARRPHGAARAVERHGRADARSLLLGRAGPAEAGEEVEHGVSCLKEPAEAVDERRRRLARASSDG
jgi:hypothetical protein